MGSVKKSELTNTIIIEQFYNVHLKLSFSFCLNQKVLLSLNTINKNPSALEFRVNIASHSRSSSCFVKDFISVVIKAPL